MILFCQDGCSDIVTGESIPYTQRIWTIRRNGKAAAFFPGEETPMHGHEWWSADGRYIWFVHYGHGTFKADLNTHELIRVRPTPLPVSHSHAARTDTLLATDICCEEWDHMSVLFTDLTNGKEVFLVNAMPKIPYIKRNYHCHPHPHFSVSDRYITYTTTLNEQVNVAVAPVAPLLDRTRG